MPSSKSKRPNLLRILFLLALMAGTVWIIRKHAAPTWHENSGRIFGTTYTIKYCADRDLSPEILAELQAVDRSLSMFNPQSTIARINRNDTDTADARLAEIFQLSNRISQSTEGAFDVTVAPLVNAWGFGFENADSITPEQVDSILQFVGWNKVTLQQGRIRKQDRRIMMDFSAVAKGYGVDCAARILEKHGVKDYYVWIGGEMRIKGHNPDGKVWVIGIQNPTTDSADPASQIPQTAVRLTDCALATSGNYNRYYIKDGRRIAHTIDPHTGYPAGHSLLSATVRAHDCATADALATAFMSMGTDKALAYLKEHTDVAAYLISADSLGRPLIHKSGAWDEICP